MSIETSQLKTFDVEVRQFVRITLDASKFTPEFMADFRQSFFPLGTISEHAEHLAQLFARGVAELSKYAPAEFVEGYGPIGEMGVSAEIFDTVVEDATPVPADREGGR
jgi:hypothetical protein